jgi:hypothetical protein
LRLPAILDRVQLAAGIARQGSILLNTQIWLWGLGCFRVFQGIYWGGAPVEIAGMSGGNKVDNIVGFHAMRLPADDPAQGMALCPPDGAFEAPVVRMSLQHPDYRRGSRAGEPVR